VSVYLLAGECFLVRFTNLNRQVMYVRMRPAFSTVILLCPSLLDVTNAPILPHLGGAGKGNSHFWLRLGFQNINTLERDLKKRSNKS
jgi:hypothetical protein